MINIKTLIKIVFILFIVNGIDSLGRVCDDCCDCFKDKKIKETREFEEIKEYVGITAEDLVNADWFKNKKDLVLKIFLKKDDNDLSSTGGKEKITIEFKEQGNINLYCLQENEDVDFKMKNQKWAFFEIKTEEEKKPIYLYCSDIESFKHNFWIYGIFKDMKYISISVIACDTVNINNMSYMFYGCFLKILNIENFNTINVENMVYMFCDCFFLKILNIENFNTRFVKDMSYMFYNCFSLENLKIGPNFDITNVSDVSYMFSNCSKILKKTKIELKKANEIINYFKNLTKEEDFTKIIRQ